jgi:4,4'-diaponeurosporenoate glycosyltransferase
MLIFVLVTTILSVICSFLILCKIPYIKPPKDNEDEQPFKYSLSIIIPAYNEEKRLPALLKSLDMQSFKQFETIVVDDYSTDKTAQIAADFGATVYQSLELNEGWIGKTRACWSGALRAKGEVILFLDADTEFTNPESLYNLAGQFAQTGYKGMLSVQPFHETIKLYESFSAIFNIVLMAGMNIFTAWGNLMTGSGAFGPCIICNRDDYFITGGHKAIKGSIMDDIEIGKLFDRKGLPLQCFGGRDIIRFRMYEEGFSQLCEGWTKNFSSGARSTKPFVFVMIVLWISGGFSIPVMLIHSIVQQSTIAIIGYALLYIVYMSQIIRMARLVGNFNLLTLMVFPIQHIFFAAVFVWSTFRTRILHTVKWRGRKIDV